MYNQYQVLQEPRSLPHFVTKRFQKLPTNIISYFFLILLSRDSRSCLLILPVTSNQKSGVSHKQSVGIEKVQKILKTIHI